MGNAAIFAIRQSISPYITANKPAAGEVGRTAMERREGLLISSHKAIHRVVDIILTNYKVHTFLAFKLYKSLFSLLSLTGIPSLECLKVVIVVYMAKRASTFLILLLFIRIPS